EVVEDRGDVTRAFRSIPAAELSANGYVVSEHGFYTYYAPDAEVLLSDEFAARHCFRVVTRVADGDTLVGLAFEPTRGSRGTDIEGARWMDARTSELRHVSYVYRGLVQTRDRPEFGGVVHFLRLEGGGWIVDDWVLRMPFIAVDAENPPVMRRRQATGRLAGVQEVGGTVRPDRAGVRANPVLRGVVVDSAGSPVQGVAVWIHATPFSARTDSLGAYEFNGVRPGTYAVSLRSPEIDSLGVPPRTTTVRLPDTTIRRLTYPSRAEMAARLCGEDARLARRAVVRVFVLDSATGGPLRGARVHVRWRADPARLSATSSADRVQANTVEVNGELDDQG